MDSSLPPWKGMSPSADYLLDAPDPDDAQDGPLLMFTPDDEVREASTRTTAEAIASERDLRGISAHQAILNLQDRGEFGADVEVPALLARALRDLTVRNAAGVYSNNVWLMRLEQEVEAIADEDKAAYLQATLRCPDMTNDRSRRLAMLQRMEASNGNEAVDRPRLAARRLVRYWEERLHLFGDPRCYLPMTMHGAMREEVAPLLAHPVHQILPGVDRAGRVVLLSDIAKSVRDALSIESEMKHLWYVFECMCENNNAMARGIVAISDYSGATIGHFDPELIRRQQTVMAEVFPLHLRSIHLVHPNDVSRSIGIPLRKRVAGRHLRLRTVVHSGSELGVLTSLDDYGLERPMLWTDIGGGAELDAQSWVHKRLALEYSRELESQHQSSSSTIPSESSLTPDSTVGATSSSAVNLSSASTPSVAKDSYNELSTALALALVDKMKGPRTDKRMSEAVKAKIKTPKMAAFDALKAGGFEYPETEKGTNPNNVVDPDGVSLQQRKNQLARRLRHTRKAFADEKERQKREAMEEN